jgi:FixJ family two-component response regulator
LAQTPACDTDRLDAYRPRLESANNTPAEHEQVRQVPVISIVEDDEPVRTGLKSLVRSLGYVAYSFASAEEYLQSPHMPETSCLITDVQMPKMSGFELQRHLQENGHKMPIIFITGFPEARFRARALETGAVCFLAKPFEAQVLVDCLTRALSLPKGPGAPAA